MPIYKYELLVTLPDNEQAFDLMGYIHGAVCGGAMITDENGEERHECAREWECAVHEFVPVVHVPQDALAAAEDFNGE